MIEKDYIKRQIDLFFQELTALLSKKPTKEIKLKELNYLSEKYTNHTLTYFIDTPIENIISAYKEEDDTLEIISELLLQIENNKEVLSKNIQLIEHINKVSTCFSFQRSSNLQKIKATLLSSYSLLL